jgi:hypothetical protein
MTTQSLVKQVMVAQLGIQVVIIRRHDEHLLRPYLVFQRDVRSGEISAAADFTCETTALLAADSLLKMLTKMERQMTAPKFNQ